MFTDNSYEAFDFSEWWSTLDVSFISFYFLAFVFLLVLIYYLTPKKERWIVLLAGSCAFYSIIGFHPMLTVILSAFIVYLAGLLIESAGKEKKKKQRLYLSAVIIVLLSVLIFTKCYSLFGWNFKYVIPVGISYYTFSAISYLADVYWRKDQAEKNFFKLLLFLLFFPKILQGPIATHKNLAPQLNEGHDFHYTKFCFGIQLAIWGYFKKLVVADRIGIITSTVFANHDDYGGAILFISMLLAALQLYCDFSGCMDIAGGVAQMFGIELERNFNHPFFAKSAAEFWQRWHMTLSGWFKDYLFLPVSRSKWVKKFSKFMGTKFGATARKNSVILIASFFVWMATGLWHGSGWPYIIWGLYWYVIINSSTLLVNKYKKLTGLLHIDTERMSWKVFQMVRTYLLFSFGRLLTIPNNLAATGEIIGKIFTKVQLWQLFDGTLYTLGLSMQELHIAGLGILAVWTVEVLQTKYVLRERISNWNLLVRCVFYSSSVLLVLVFGMYGIEYGNSSFIYMNY